MPVSTFEKPRGVVPLRESKTRPSQGQLPQTATNGERANPLISLLGSPLGGPAFPSSHQQFPPPCSLIALPARPVPPPRPAQVLFQSPRCDDAASLLTTPRTKPPAHLGPHLHLPLTHQRFPLQEALPVPTRSRGSGNCRDNVPLLEPRFSPAPTRCPGSAEPSLSSSRSWSHFQGPWVRPLLTLFELPMSVGRSSSRPGCMQSQKDFTEQSAVITQTSRTHLPSVLTRLNAVVPGLVFTVPRHLFQEASLGRSSPGRISLPSNPTVSLLIK